MKVMRKKFLNTKAEWTTGPWMAIDRSVGGAFQIIPGPNDPGDLRIATVTNAPNDFANARLIAAAPEMYEALAAIKTTWDEYDGSSKNATTFVANLASVMDELNAVLARANSGGNAE
jgi:hypothetical protein